MENALLFLDAALGAMKVWDEKAQEGKQLLNDVIKSRRAAAENHTLLRCACIGSLPDHTVSCKITAGCS